MLVATTTTIIIIITLHIRATAIINNVVFIIIITIIIDDYIIETIIIRIAIAIAIALTKLRLAATDPAALLPSMEEPRSSRRPSDELGWDIPGPFFESVSEGHTNLRREVHLLKLHLLCIVLPTKKAAMAGAGDGLCALRGLKETKVGRIMERA
jgi:hypothetical protein